MEVVNYSITSNNPVIDLFPQCEITVSVDKKDWDLLKIDSVVFLNNPFFPTTVFDYNSKPYIVTECSAFNKITYYYYSNGLKSKTYYFEIFTNFETRNGNKQNVEVKF